MENNTICDQALNNSLCWNDASGVGGVLITDVEEERIGDEEEEGGDIGGGGGGGGVGGGGRFHKKDDWESIREELQWAFPVHIYGFSCLFFMLAFYTFFSILNLRSQISSRPFMSTINVFLCVLGVTRAACFLIEPYTSGQVMPGFLGSFMWDVGFPCILSAFSLIQLAFSQLTQVKFRPEWLRRKSALSLLITSHFALVFGSDIATAFENHLQVVRWIVQSIFLSWGLVLCITFLYGGTHIIRLLRTIPQNAFQEGVQTCAAENKGILQLALLAQCNNIASTVLTAAATTASCSSSVVGPTPVSAPTISSASTPQPMTPKIKITDEFDQTFSYGIDGTAAGTSSGKSAVSTSLIQTNESEMKSFDVCTIEITEEEEEGSLCSVEIVSNPQGEKENNINQKNNIANGNASTSPGKCESKTSSSTMSNDPKYSKVKDYKTESKNSNSRGKTKIIEDTKVGDIIIKVEEVDSNCNTQLNDVKTKSSVNEVNTIVQIEGKNSNEVKVSEYKRKEKVKEMSKFKQFDSLKVKRGSISMQTVKSLDSLLMTGSAEGKSEYGNGDTVRRGSYTEGVTNSPKSKLKDQRKDSLPNASFSKGHLKPDGSDTIGVPKRKKSLTWSEDTQTIECPTKEGVSPSRKSSIHEDCERIIRDNHRKSSVSSRRNSRSYGSEKGRIRNNRTNEYSDLIVVGAGGRRRSSTVSSCSLRKNSEQWQTLAFPGPREHRSLSVSSAATVSACGSRRSSRKSLRDDAEVEALLERSPMGQDVTLASILNHIAYVNQAATVSKLPRPLKDSRKAQVQQVLIVTYVTAVLGTILSLALVYRVYGYFSSGFTSTTAAAAAAAALPTPPWLWFTYESSCRFLEFLMGCAMANITRQPLNSTITRRHSQYHPNSIRFKQRNSIYNI